MHGVALDVTRKVKICSNGTFDLIFLMRKSPEPLPRGHPLITGQFPNLIIAPHWGTATDATVKAMTKGIFSD